MVSVPAGVSSGAMTGVPGAAVATPAVASACGVYVTDAGALAGDVAVGCVRWSFPEPHAAAQRASARTTTAAIFCFITPV